MALGIGVGFEDNIPMHTLESDMESILGNLQKTVNASTLDVGNAAVSDSFLQYDAGEVSRASVRNSNGLRYEGNSSEGARQMMKQAIIEAITESNLDRNMARSVSNAMEGVGIYCDMRQIGRINFA